MALGMNNFDSIVFLTNFNDGYAMSIPDIAKKFYVIDEKKNGDGVDKVATITCHNEKGVPGGRAGIIGADSPKVCNNPEFKINRYRSSQMGLTEAILTLIFRQLVHLPHLDQTADKVFNRIIPAPNGDCKLIAYPGDANFPDYQMTLTGLSSAIPCGLTAAINVDGTAVPIEGDSNGQKPQTGSDPGQSTNNQGGAFVAPPSKKPFKPLDPNGYACIFKSGNGPFCLPPGTYSKQSGLGFEIKEVDSLSLPPGGWSLAVHWKSVPAYRSPRPQGYTDTEYKDNEAPRKDKKASDGLKMDMDAINTNTDGEASFTIKAPNDGPDPVCCLFTEPHFKGDVWCVGVGGDDILHQWKDKAQSVSCHNGGNVWLYAKEYGDAGGALIKGNVDDLKDEPYGNDHGSFSKNVKALWVLKG